MSNVIRFPYHYWHSCNDPKCFICEGALAACVICGGGESSLPSHCPGERMNYEVQQKISAGELDYDKYRGWIGAFPKCEEA